MGYLTVITRSPLLAWTFACMVTNLEGGLIAEEDARSVARSWL